MYEAGFNIFIFYICTFRCCMQYYVFFTGLLVSILMATLGAYFSRRVKIDYSLLLGLCFVNYFMTGFTAGQHLTVYASICFAVTLAVVDLTLGADLSKRIGFYSKEQPRQRKGFLLVAANAFIVCVAGIMGMYGGLAAGH